LEKKDALTELSAEPFIDEKWTRDLFSKGGRLEHLQEQVFMVY